MVLIEISGNCNLSCKRCPRRQRPGKTGNMELELFKEIIDKLCRTHLSRVIYGAGYGESFVNPDLLPMLEYAKTNGFTIMMPTNGTLIKENLNSLQLIDQLHLSIDSLTNPDLKCDPSKIIETIPLLKKRSQKVLFSVTLGKENWNDIESFFELSKKYNYPILFVYANPMYEADQEVMDDYKFCMKHHEELLIKIQTAKINAGIDEGCKSFKKCRFIKNDFAIDWEGYIYPCSVGFFYPEYKFGHVNDYITFDTFLNDVNMEQVRAGLHQVCNFCKKCDRLWEEMANDIFERSRKGVVQYKDLYEDRNCFILATGPSLNKVDFKLLKKAVSEGAILWSMNTFFNGFETFGIKPHFYACSDGYTFKENYQNLLKLDMPLFLSNGSLSVYLKDIQKYKDVQKNEPILLPQLGYMFESGHFSRDPSIGVYNGDTVTIDICLQMALYMGFKRVYLLGCDCDYSGVLEHFDGTAETNLICPARAGDFSRIFTSYEVCKRVFEQSGREIINLTEPSKLTIFRRMKLEEIIK